LLREFEVIVWNDGFIFAVLREIEKGFGAVRFQVRQIHVTFCSQQNDQWKAFAVLWHMDDSAISCKDKKAVDQFIERAINKHEDNEIAKLKPSRGMVNDHLGITSDCSETGVTKLCMKERIRKMLERKSPSIQLN